MTNNINNGGKTDMQKKMLELIVSTSEGQIFVEGPEYTNDKGEVVRDYIMVSPDQVDTLISWLQEAKAELLAAQ
jgi:UDP-glucose 4-epimerase